MLKKIVLTTSLIAGFFLSVTLIALYVQYSLNVYGYCPIPASILIPLFASLGVFVGTLVYYIMLGRIEESKEKRIQAVKSLLEILPFEEREVLTKLIENKGNITQAKISKELGKVKAFRTIESLRKKGIIEKVQHGKTNLIKFKEKYFKILLE
jgi:uncharacterized membrane protein